MKICFREKYATPQSQAKGKRGCGTRRDPNIVSESFNEKQAGGLLWNEKNLETLAWTELAPLTKGKKLSLLSRRPVLGQGEKEEPKSGDAKKGNQASSWDQWARKGKKGKSVMDGKDVKKRKKKPSKRRNL